MLQTRQRLIRLSRHKIWKQCRCYESSRAGSDHSGTNGHSHAHPEPVNESLGRGFFIAIAVIPFSLALYKFSHSSNDGSANAKPPLFTRLISKYSDWEEQWKTRNEIHTAMMEQAAFDKNLFRNTPGSGMVELKFPEIFNTGSPYNVPAGHSANLDELIAHYEKKNRETEERRVKRVQEAERLKEVAEAAEATTSE